MRRYLLRVATRFLRAYSGDNTYATASGSASVTVTAAPVLTLSVNQRTQVVLGAPVTVHVQAMTASNGPLPTGTITYAVDGGAGTTVSLGAAATVAFTVSGLNLLKHTVVVTYNGDSTYSALSQSLVLNGDVAQVILFRGLSNRSLATAPVLSLAARATSGLPVSYSVTGPATLSGAILTLTGTGTVTVTATQAGNSNFGAAAPVTRSFVSQ